MALDINLFIGAHNNLPYEVEDASNLDQCFDLALGYCDWLRVPRDTIRHLYAHQIYDQADNHTRDYFLVIPNTATNVPEMGDIVVFGTGVGVAGHVSIFVHGDARSFTSFDQNWDTAHFNDGRGHPICRLVVHNYDYGPVLGWLRPKGSGAATTNEGTEEMIWNPDDVRDLYVTLLGRAASPSEAQSWAGKSWHDVYYAIKDSPEAAAYKARFNDYPRVEKELADLKAKATAPTPPPAVPPTNIPVDGVGKPPPTPPDSTPKPLPPIEPQPVKPGTQTTEFYTTILSNVLAGAVLLGDIPLPPGSPVWLDGAIKAAAAIGAFYVNRGYGSDRKDIKVAATQATAQINDPSK